MIRKSTLVGLAASALALTGGAANAFPAERYGDYGYVPAYYGGSMGPYVCTRETGGSLNLRQGPTRNHRVVARIPNGAPVYIQSAANGGDRRMWFFVQTPSGFRGWVREDFVCGR